VAELNPADAPDNQMQKTLQVLRDINRKLKEIKAELDTPEHRLSHLCSVLKSPGQNLEVKTVSFKLSRMGVRLESSSTEPANEFNVAELEPGQDLKQAVVWVRVEPKCFLGSL